VRRRRVTGFGTGHVFDVSQTDGEPLPTLDVPTLEGDAGAELWVALTRVAATEGVSVKVVPPAALPPDTMGYYVPATKEIVVGAYNQRQRTKTLAHELGHHVARVDDRAENECIAEGIAYVVCAHFGIDTGERSFPYVASWAKDKGVLKGVLGTIQSASARIIDAVSTEPSNRLTER
jgi:antirestriction protein ArdC